MEIPSEHGWLSHHLTVQVIIFPSSTEKHRINKELKIFFLIIIIKLNSNVPQAGPPQDFGVKLLWRLNEILTSLTHRAKWSFTSDFYRSGYIRKMRTWNYTLWKANNIFLRKMLLNANLISCCLISCTLFNQSPWKKVLQRAAQEDHNF